MQLALKKFSSHLNFLVIFLERKLKNHCVSNPYKHIFIYPEQFLNNFRVCKHLTSKFWQIGFVQSFLLLHFLLSCHPHIFRAEFALGVNLHYLCFQGCALKLRIQLKLMFTKNGDFNYLRHRGESFRPV